MWNKLRISTSLVIFCFLSNLQKYQNSTISHHDSQEITLNMLPRFLGFVGGLAPPPEEA
jgi:hypothetical protein